MTRRPFPRLFAGAAVLCLIVASCWPSAIAAVEYPCASGYVQVEDQSWWIDANGEEFPGRHVHQQFCWPTGVVSGELSIPVRVLLHAQPEGAELTRVRLKDAGRGDVWAQTSFPDASPDANGNLVVNVTVQFDTDALSTGAHEMQLAAVVDQPNGNQQFVTSGHVLYVRSTSGGTSRTWNEARSWYTDFAYENARTKTPLADFRVISQPFSFHAQCAAPSGAAVTGCSVWVDMDAHNGSLGTNVLPLVNGPSSRTATVSGLAPGLHKLAIKTDATHDFGPTTNGTNSGLEVITVLVPGTVPTPSPTAPPTPVPTPAPSVCQ